MSSALMNAACIGTGGFLGALARYWLSGLVHRMLPMTSFPFGTLAVNLLGCLAIGLLSGLIEARQIFGPELRAFVLIGIMGSFTTFSTFGFETFAMLRDEEYLRAVSNIGLQVVLGLLLVWIGFSLTASR